MSSPIVNAVKIIDCDSGNWWCKLCGQVFPYVSIKIDTVTMQGLNDEGVLELPREAVEFVDINDY